MEKLPIAVIIPHAGLTIPPEVTGRVALTQAQIFNEADVFAEELYDFRGRVLHWVSFPFARAVVDVNRPDDPARTRPGDGIIKHQTSYGTPTFHTNPDSRLERQLIDTYWKPWHEKLAAIAQDSRVKLVLDAHTMAAVGPAKYDDPSALRPRSSVSNYGDPAGNPYFSDIPISAPPELTRAFADIMAPLVADLPVLAEPGRDCAINSPFYGGYDIARHGGRHQPWFMFEISRALYVGHQTGNTPVQPPNLPLIATIRERVWQGLVALMGVL